MKSLYRMCARHSLLPRSLQIKACYDPTEIPHSRGGFADVWKGEYGDQAVAIKVLGISTTSDLKKISRVSHRWCSQSQFQCTLTVTRAEVLRGVRDMEGSPLSERVAAVRSDNVRE